MISASDFKIIIQNSKGSYKSFEIKNDPAWASYPLKGITYPVDYGYAEDYQGEDGAELDIFVGTGNLQGYITVWRIDIPTETKFFVQVTHSELADIKKVFATVLQATEILNDKAFIKKIDGFKSRAANLT